jgi:thiol-disulfide isomerase/thioredoxin
LDLKLDANTLHIRDTANAYADLYVDLVNKYLTNIVTLYDKNDGVASHRVSYTKDGVDVIANKLQVPFLFTYNKNHKDAQGNNAPIISQLEKMYVWNDFLTNGAVDNTKIEAYKSEVRPVFDAISEQVSGKKVAKYDTFDAYEYYSTAYNKAANAQIFTEADKNVVLKTVSYHELTKILESEGNYVFIFGGSWCPNTRAVIKYVNQYAKKYNIDTVYNFDTRLDANKLHIRDTANPYANHYVDLVNKYLTNIVTQYDKNDGNPSHRISYTKDGVDVIASKLQVPFVFVYNKDHKDTQGISAPILGSIELMYTWANIQPDYVGSDGVIGKNYKTYTTELDNLFRPLAASNLSSLVSDTESKVVDQNLYTSASYQKYSAALAAAKTISVKSDATRDEVSDAYAELETAAAGLTLKSGDSSSETPSNSSSQNPSDTSSEPNAESEDSSTNDPADVESTDSDNSELNESGSAITGDANIGIVLAVFMVAGLGVTLLAIRRKRIHE